MTPYGIEYTKQQVWQWLKAERKWWDKERQRLRAEAGPQRVFNRANRRRLGMKRIGRM